MRVIAYNADSNLEEESYVTYPGQPIESFQIKKVFLWKDEATDVEIKKRYPDKSWDDYQKYLLTRFPEGQPIIIKITEKKNKNS